MHCCVLQVLRPPLYCQLVGSLLLLGLSLLSLQHPQAIYSTIVLLFYFYFFF